MSRSDSLGRWAAVAAALVLGLLLGPTLHACSGPPAPRVAILPSKITYTYFDYSTGVESAPIEVPLIDESANPIPQPGMGPYMFCDLNASPPQVNCYDDSRGLARLEIPANAKVTFQAYYDNKTTKTPRQNIPITNQFSPMSAFIADLNNSNRQPRIRLSEIQGRNSGNSFTVGGGLKPRLILDWAGVSSESLALGIPPPQGYRILFNSSSELPEPAGWQGSAWQPQFERWYHSAGEITDGKVVVRTVDRHMNSDAQDSLVPPEVWLKAEIDSDNEIRRVHAWVATFAQFQGNTSNMYLALDANDPASVSSQWWWDLSPAQAGAGPGGGFVHLPLTGSPTSGVGFSPDFEYDSGPDPLGAGEVATFNNAFRRTHEYVTPSEPGGYMVKVKVGFNWKYGAQPLGYGGEDWTWQSSVRYLGYLHLKDAALPGNHSLAAKIQSIRTQLFCLPVEGNDCPVGNYDDTTFNVDTFVSQAMAGDPSNPIALAEGIFSDFVKQEIGNAAWTAVKDGHYAGVEPSFEGGGSDTPMTYRFQGTFPQTSGDTPPGTDPPPNEGRPGYAFVIVRDTSAPRHYRFVDRNAAGYYRPDDGFVDGIFVIKEGETGRKLSETLAEAGKGSLLEVEVFDDNPGLVAFSTSSTAGGPATLEGGGLSGSIGAYAPLADQGRPPSIQVWYSVEKAGYSYQPGDFTELAGDFAGDEGSGERNAWVLNRNQNLSDDSYLLPTPSFRFYPFRDAASGEIKEYTPTAYDLRVASEPDGSNDPIAAKVTYVIDLNDMLEPMGLHFADGSKPSDDDPDDPRFPGFDPDKPYTLKLFIRASDARVASGPRSNPPFLQFDPRTGFYVGGTGLFEEPNWVPFWHPKSERGSIGPDDPFFPNHEPAADGPSMLFARKMFPDNVIPKHLDRDVGKQQPPPTSTQIAQEALDVGFTDATIYGKAAGLAVKDTVPPTVMLIVTDTKYGRSAFFGNKFVGEMSSKALQEILKNPTGAGTPALVTAPTLLVDPAMTPSEEQGAAIKLFPPTWADYDDDDIADGAAPSPHGMAVCAQPTDRDCMPTPTDGVATWEWRFEAGGEPAGYAAQLDQIVAGTFNPPSFFAEPTVPALGAMTEAPGLWVDEDTRLVFRVVAWDNLNSYLPATTSLDGTFQNVFVKGADPAPGLGSRNALEVTIHDPQSGAQDLSLTGGDIPTWPSYIFRNPNRLDAGGSLTKAEGASTNDADTTYVEVTYTDDAGNTTNLHVKFFVVENSLRILSLKEEKFRSFN